jgi:putative intracellular protease/amidase
LDRRDDALFACVGRASDADPETGFCPTVVCEEKKMNRKMLFLAKAVVYVLAFLVPPVLITVVGMRAVESARYEGPPDAAKVQAGGLPAPPRHDPDKPTAVVLLSNQGAEVTDVLAPYEVLSESGVFNVYAAAPEREAVTLSGGLDVMPQLSLAELGQRLDGEDPDVIVVPEMPEIGSPGHRPVAEWLREHAEATGTVMSVCNGAQVLADAGLLDGRRATANWANIAEWERRYPDTEWVRGLRYVEDGNVITAAGVTSGIGATLHVIRGYVGEEAATALAQKIGYSDQRIGDEPRIPADRLTVSDRALYVLWTAYGWGKPKIGVVLTEETSEIELASVLDVYPGPVLTANTTTLTPEGPRSPVRSEHGLYFVSRSDLDSAPGFDRVFVPGRAAPSVTDPRVRSWAKENGLKLEFIHADAPAGFPLDATLSDLAEHENAPVARFTARLLEYPIGHLELAGGGWPFAHLLRPLAVGFLGLALAVLAGRLLGPATKRFRHSPKGASTAAKPVAKARR